MKYQVHLSNQPQLGKMHKIYIIDLKARNSPGSHGYLGQEMDGLVVWKNARCFLVGGFLFFFHPYLGEMIQFG